MTSLPVPDLSPQPVTYETFMELVPEKFEWVGGYLFDGRDEHQCRERLLAMLLANEGLIRIVQLAPPERWRGALRQAYSDDGRC